jgi:hypothetical protein
MSDTCSLFRILAGDLRRHLLVLLCETESLRVPEDLRRRSTTQTQTSQQAGLSGDPPRSTDRLAISLQQNHLPQLEDHGYVEWDRETNTVSRGDSFDEIEPTLRTLLANADDLPADFFTFD